MKLFAPATLLAALALIACGDDKDPADDTTGSPTGDPSGDPTANMTDATTTDATTTDATTTTPSTDPTTTEPTTEPTTDATTGPGEGLSFATDVFAPILEPSCSCHLNGAAGGFMMGADAATAYAAMVGKPSTGSPLNYVTASDSSQSYIFHKVNNTHVEAGGAGGRMPLGGMLTPDQIATIETWIDDGALP
jgi:hypothetical protein